MMLWKLPKLHLLRAFFFVLCRLDLLKFAASTLTIFEDDDLLINSEALPAIWEKWDDFVSKSEDFEFFFGGS